MNVSGLNEANQTCLDEMKFYLLSGPASEKKVREVLAELEDHLLEAQKKGKSFEDVFGKDPRTFCDELVQELPKRGLREKAQLAAVFLPLVLLWQLVDGFQGRLELALYHVLIYVAVCGALIFPFIYVLRLAAFKSTRYAFVVMYMLCTFTIVLFVAILWQRGKLPSGPTLVLEGTPAYAISAISLAIIIASIVWEPLRRSFRRSR